MNIYVIRHGETDMGKNKVIATEVEPLNSNGIQQAINVGKELNKLNIDLIYCSPIERAKHTLKLCNLKKNIPVIIEDRLKERDMGIYEMVGYQEQFIGILMALIIHYLSVKIVKYTNTV